MMTIGDVSVLIPSVPSIPAMVLKTGASKAQHAFVGFAFSLVGEPMLFDLVEAARIQQRTRRPPPPVVLKEVGAVVVATAAAHASSPGPRLVVAACSWTASTIKTALRLYNYKGRRCPPTKNQSNVVDLVSKYQVMLIEGGTGLGRPHKCPSSY